MYVRVRARVFVLPARHRLTPEQDAAIQEARKWGFNSPQLLTAALMLLGSRISGLRHTSTKALASLHRSSSSMSFPAGKQDPGGLRPELEDDPAARPLPQVFLPSNLSPALSRTTEVSSCLRFPHAGRRAVGLLPSYRPPAATAARAPAARGRGRAVDELPSCRAAEPWTSRGRARG